MVILLVGCAAQPREAKLSVGDGVSYTEPEAEAYPVIPQGYAVKHRNGVKQDKNQLKKKRNKETWVFDHGQ